MILWSKLNRLLLSSRQAIVNTYISYKGMDMNKFIGFLAISSFALGSTVLAEGDIETGRALSTQCSACHGNDGMSNSEQWPNIAGQKESYLAAQLTKYKTGERTDPVMSAIVGPLNEQNILDLSAFYASNSAVANFDFNTLVLTIPYVVVDDTSYNVEMTLDDVNALIFSVKSLTPH